MKILYWICVLFFFAGCASHENFVQKYDGWMGRHIAHFIQENGYPDSQYELPNTHKVYVYQRTQMATGVLRPTFGYGYGTFGGMGIFGIHTDVVQKSCHLYIETDKEGIIVRWDSRGNNCRL